MNITITNICFKGNIASKIILHDVFTMESILFQNSNIKYNPKKFPGLRIRFTNGSCLLFGSGYYSICGCKTFENGKLARNELFTLLQKHGIDVKNRKLLLTNICITFKMMYPLRLIDLFNDFPNNCTYEVEIFPAAKFKLDNISFTCHHTGIIFATGFKDFNSINVICNSMHNILLKYIK